MRLKDSDQKFSRDLGECWMNFVDDYSQVSRDYGLSPQQKLQYLLNLLINEAKRFYLAEVEKYAKTFQLAAEMIYRECSSPVRQKRVKNYLKTLSLSSSGAGCRR